MPQHSHFASSTSDIADKDNKVVVVAVGVGVGSLVRVLSMDIWCDISEQVRLRGAMRRIDLLMFSFPFFFVVYNSHLYLYFMLVTRYHNAYL